MIELEQSLFKTASQIEQHLNASFQEAFHISFSEFLILSKLYNDDESTIANIQRDIEYKMDSASIKTKKLREIGYVDKMRRKDDERKVRVVLTDEGRKIVEQVREGYNELIETNKDLFTAEDALQLLELLEKYRTSMAYALPASAMGR